MLMRYVYGEIVTMLMRLGVIVLIRCVNEVC